MGRDSDTKTFALSLSLSLSLSLLFSTQQWQMVEVLNPCADLVQQATEN
jgi:hypothetical protein